jgi:diadenosine tetraphosphate (Ap4A) HIT family hydrolase
VKDPSCPECRLVLGTATARGLPALRLGQFVVHPRPETPPVPGWMIVAPARHVEQWDELDARELAELGPLVARVAVALRAETATAKVYVSVFAEVLPHLHVHVVARPPDLAPEKRGAQVFLEAHAREGSDSDALLARRIHARLGERSVEGSPWTAVLLSGLLWPGAGQIRNGEWGKGLLFALGGALVFGRFAWRVAVAALGAMIEAPAPMDLPQMIRLAEQIRSRNAPELGVLTFFLVLVWTASVFDAWGTARRAR